MLKTTTMALSKNPIYVAIKEQIQDLLWDDMSKSDIREMLKQNSMISEEIFEAAYSDAFASLVAS